MLMRTMMMMIECGMNGGWSAGGCGLQRELVEAGDTLPAHLDPWSVPTPLTQPRQQTPSIPSRAFAAALVLIRGPLLEAQLYFGVLRRRIRSLMVKLHCPSPSVLRMH